MSPEIIAADQIEITSGQDSLSMYQFGTNVAKHYFCKTCGIYPFHETMRKPGCYRVNLGCVDNIDPYALKIDVFDGKKL